MEVGIESLNVYGGQACLDVRTLFEARGLDLERFNNLMMEQKAVGLPWEDGVTHAVNAALPLLEGYSEAEKNRIELVITATESGIDFAKSMSTYIHRYLGLSRHCRLFEVKQACYGGTAALQMAASWIKSQASPGAKALVLAADVIMSDTLEEPSAGIDGEPSAGIDGEPSAGIDGEHSAGIGGEPSAGLGKPSAVLEEASRKYSYAEPSSGVAGVAMIVSDNPVVLALDFGANGYFSYEVNDACRPSIRGDAGDPDLSLLSYLDCVEGSFTAYADKVEGADFRNSFDYLAFHTPFAGMVKGAHRKAMRTFAGAKPQEIDSDFERRVMPSLRHCVKVGGVYSATLYLALSSLLDHIPRLAAPTRIGLFSYGSGCASEFFSGVITPQSQLQVNAMRIGEALANRYALSMDEYSELLELSAHWPFGVNNREVDIQPFYNIYKKQVEHKGYLIFKGVKDYQREYGWS